MYFVFVYGNRRMKPIEIVLRRGKGKNREGGKSKIFSKHLCKYYNVSLLQLLYANKNF
jgi:hypothetical protein